MSEIATIEKLNSLLAPLIAGQAAMNGALGLMIDTLQAQTNLLRELAAAASDEPGPSPVLESLDELTVAVQYLGVSMETMAIKFDQLPDEIAAALEAGPERA